MAFLMIRIECPGMTVGDMNAKLSGDSGHEGANKLVDLLAGAAGGCVSAQIDCAVRSDTQEITANGGDTASYNLK